MIANKNLFQLLISDGYIERLSEQTFVSAIGNRLAVAFQKMIRITVAEGLKRMYKEYRLKQWQMLLDKAARLRRLLEHQEREENQQGQTDNPLAIENPIGNPDQQQATTNRQQPSVRTDDLRTHETQHDWQRAAPEAYDWQPVTDYRMRANSTTDNTRDSDRFPTMVPLSVVQNHEVLANSSSMDFESSEPTVSNSQDSSVQQTVSSEQPQTVSSNQTATNRLHPDISEMVEAMEAIFHDSDDEASPDEDQPQTDSNQLFLESLTSPIPRPQWNMTMTSSPGRTLSHNETSSPAGTGRALEGINQAGLLGETMNESSPSRRRLLWRDDPPQHTPADDPPRMLLITGGMGNPEPTYIHPSLNLRWSAEEGRLVSTNNEETAQEPNQQAQIEEPNQQAQIDTEQQDQQENELDSSLQSYISWDSDADSNDIDTLGGILYAAERLGPMDQTMHMDIEMGDMGLGHLLFDRAAGTWATSHCEFHRVN